MKASQNIKLHEHIVINKYCSVCKSADNVRFFTITDCNLCKKCNDELAKSFELAMKKI